MSDQTLELPRAALAAGEGMYVTGEDGLRITSLNSAASVTLTLGGRILLVDRARPQPLTGRHVPNTDRTAATTDHDLGEGWLQNLTVIASAGTPLLGAAYARVDLIRGRGASATVLATLLEGLVTAGRRLSWPGALLRGPIDGPGNIRLIAGANPGAGSELAETVPTGARWRLRAFEFEFRADATVANREVVLVFDDGATIYARHPGGVAQTASQNVRYTFGPQGDRVAGAVVLAHAVPTTDPTLLAGHRIRTVTSNLQAGDDYTDPTYQVEEWLEGN